MRYRILCLALAGSLVFCGAPSWAQQTAPAQEQQAPNPLNPPAPAAPTEPVPDWLQYQNPYTATETDLSNPHRTSDEIISWAQQQITNSMSFNPEEFNDKVTKLRTLFTDEGWRQYVSYLKSSQLVDMVRNQHYSVTTIINGDSLIINSGPVAGTYHWLVDAPVIISFTSKDDKGMPVTVAGGNFKIDMQLGRVAQGGVDGMAIESWNVERVATTQQ